MKYNHEVQPWNIILWPLSIESCEGSLIESNPGSIRRPICILGCDGWTLHDIFNRYYPTPMTVLSCNDAFPLTSPTSVLFSVYVEDYVNSSRQFLHLLEFHVTLYFKHFCGYPGPVAKIMLVTTVLILNGFDYDHR